MPDAHPHRDVSDRGLERMAIRLYIGYARRGGAWMSLADDEKSFWRAAARDLLREAFEEN